MTSNPHTGWFLTQDTSCFLNRGHCVNRNYTKKKNPLGGFLGESNCSKDDAA